MRNTLLMLLLAAASSSAAAEWIKVTEGYSLVAYADPATIRRSGNFARMWHLLDFKDAQGGTAGISPPQSKDVTFSIPLRQRHGVFEVMATLNSEVNVFFVVDSGASVVTIPEDVARLLVRNGSLTRADFLGLQRYRFANGTIGSGKVIRLRTLDLGGHTLKDVPAVVLAGNHVPTLLGQTVLGQLGNWSINTKAATLQVTP